MRKFILAVLIVLSMTMGFDALALAPVTASPWTTTTNPATARTGLVVYSTGEVDALITAATNGLVTSAITNGLATTNYANSVTNNFTALVYTNPSSILYTSSLPALTNGFVTSSITNGLATTNYVNAATNGLVTSAITNGLATTNYVNSITNGLATTNYVNSITNRLATTNYVNAATNGFVTSSVTNGLATTNYVNAATNGLATSSITNGLATTNYVNSAITNVQATNVVGLGTAAYSNAAAFQSPLTYQPATNGAAIANSQLPATLTANTTGSSANTTNLVGASASTTLRGLSGSALLTQNGALTLTLTNSFTNSIAVTGSGTWTSVTNASGVITWTFATTNIPTLSGVNTYTGSNSLAGTNLFITAPSSAAAAVNLGLDANGRLTTNVNLTVGNATVASFLSGAVTNTTGLITNIPSGLVTNSGSATVTAPAYAMNNGTNFSVNANGNGIFGAVGITNKNITANNINAGNSAIQLNGSDGSATFAHNNATINPDGSASFAGVSGNSDYGVGASGNSYASYGVSGYSSVVAGVYGNSDGAEGVYGNSSASAGVHGYSSASAGVYGESSVDIGVSGYSSASYGVSGYSSVAAGVYGNSFYDVGVSGYSTYNIGVSGYSASSYGVEGYSASSYGVYGNSTASYGVSGYSSVAAGVSGNSDGAEGVSGNSSASAGVSGYSSASAGVTGLSTAAAGVTGNSSAAAGVSGYSSAADKYGIYGTSAGGHGVWSDGDLKVTTSASFAGGAATISTNGVFTGNGSGLTNLPPSAITNAPWATNTDPRIVNAVTNNARANIVMTNNSSAVTISTNGIDFQGSGNAANFIHSTNGNLYIESWTSGALNQRVYFGNPSQKYYAINFANVLVFENVPALMTPSVTVSANGGLYMPNAYTTIASYHSSVTAGSQLASPSGELDFPDTASHWTTNAVASHVVERTVGTVGQTGNLQEWITNTTTVATVDSNGTFTATSFVVSNGAFKTTLGTGLTLNGGVLTLAPTNGSSKTWSIYTTNGNMYIDGAVGGGGQNLYFGTSGGNTIAALNFSGVGAFQSCPAIAVSTYIGTDAGNDYWYKQTISTVDPLTIFGLGGNSHNIFQFPNAFGSTVITNGSGTGPCVTVCGQTGGTGDLMQWWDGATKRSSISTNGIHAAVGFSSTGTHTPVAVTVGASPFNLTNNTGAALECYFSGATAYTVGKNGVTVFASMIANDYFVLQPSSYTTVTYTVAPTFYTNAW